MWVVILQVIKSANVCVAASGGEEVCDILVDSWEISMVSFAAKARVSPNLKQWVLKCFSCHQKQKGKILF